MLQLVEAYCNAEGQPRQRVVASLGNAALPPGDPRRLAKAVEEQINGQCGWLDGTLAEDTAVWIVHVATAQVMISNRLIEPLSEWALIDWAQRTALPELLDVRLSKTTKDRLYRVSDELLKHRKPIETTLRDKTRDLFSLNRSVILYDVTNTHFEGVCAKNPEAKHGKNKQKRKDCRQVAVGMAFDENGFPLAHEGFEGNIGDTQTLRRMLARLALPEAGLRPVVILDAGFASKENLALLPS